MKIRKTAQDFVEADMRDVARVLSLTAALLVVGCGSDDQTFNYGPFFPGGNPPPGTAAPVAVADSFSVLGNGLLTGTVTANDTLNGAVVTGFQNPSNSGGTVALNAAGQLAYSPPAGQSNVSDTFTYTLSNSAGSSTAIVTVAIGARGLFVKNDVAVTGTGSQASPFKTLAEAVTAAVNNGDQIVLFRGDGTNTGLNTGFTLKPGQGISSLDPASPANITGPVNITTGNTIKDLRIIGTTGSAVNGTNSVGGSLSGVVIDGASVRGVSLTNSTGTFSVTNSTIRNTVSHGIVASSDTGSFIWSVTGSTFANVTGQDVFSNTTATAGQNVTVANSNSTGGALQFVFVDSASSANVGLNLTNNTVLGTGTKVRGLSVNAGATANVLALVNANNITGCTGEGIRMSFFGAANARARLSANRTLGNLAGSGLSIFTATASTANFGGIFQNNTSDVFALTRAAGTTFNVEELAQFNSVSNNTGTLITSGAPAPTDVPAGSLGIP